MVSLEPHQRSVGRAWTRSSYVKELRHGGQMGVEIALGALRDALTALRSMVSLALCKSGSNTNPCYQDVLRKARVGVLDPDEGELDAAVGEVFDQIRQFALCAASGSAFGGLRLQGRRC